VLADRAWWPVSDGRGTVEATVAALDNYIAPRDRELSSASNARVLHRQTKTVRSSADRPEPMYRYGRTDDCDD